MFSDRRPDWLSLCRRLHWWKIAEEGDEDPMRTIDQIGNDALKDHLLKNWMTHDAMWFYQVFQNYGIDAANLMNKAAIRALAAVETQRARQILGMKEGGFETFDDLKTFIDGTFSLSTGEFMGFTYHWPQENILHWAFKDGKCFAYKGMHRLGAADRYECGVLYRVLSWLDMAGVRYETSPKIEKCIQHTLGECKGEVRLFLDGRDLQTNSKSISTKERHVMNGHTRIIGST